MKPQVFKQVIKTDNGPDITIETGALAKQAHGSVVITCGKTMLLGTVVSSYKTTGLDFLPLTVDFREKFASAGKYPGGFFKREARPNDGEVLTMRLVDRVLRPLFPKDYHSEVQVMIQLMSHDENVMPDALAGLAASTVLQLSDIPFECAISEVRVGRVNGEFVINPSFEQLEASDIDMMIGASADSVMMVEGEMDEVSEPEMLQAIKFAHEAIKMQCLAQIELAEELKIVKREYSHETSDEELSERIHKDLYDQVYEIAKAQKAKHERSEAFKKVEEDYIEKLQAENEEEEVNTKLVARYFHDVEKKAVRNLILDEGMRLDGRKTNEIRPIWCEVDYLPATHGSAIFTRGETQSLTTVTLGTKMDEKIIDQVLVQGSEKFVLHYNFLPFSTGDARPYRGVGRREIGHGNLAYRALKGMVPEGEENPYAIRVVSDILESNGSSSMATVCAGTMALMDAGVKMKKPVSGIAMGLITDKDSGKFAVLSDILGDEDHLGDMDFKVTGTEDGITACQMDIKIEGLSYEIMNQALDQAKEGRMHILGEMLKTIPEPRADYKPHTPRIVQITIPKDMIGAVIGPGGKVIQDMQEKTGATITITQEGDIGIVDIFAEDKAAIDEALRMVNGITEVPEVGKVYKGKVKSVVDFGAFVEILPGKEGLLHISELEWRRVEKVSEVLKEGEEVDVKVIEVDKRNGKLKLSRKALLPRPEKKKNPEDQKGEDRNR